MHVATFHAKFVFHFELPDWTVRFNDDNIRCHSDPNVTLPCYQLREVLAAAVTRIHSDMQVYTQAQICDIHRLVRDLPIDTIDRSKRGVMTELLSRITFLPSQTDLRAVVHVLEQIEKGYYEASVLWGKGEKSLMAAFKPDQNRMQNVFDILAEYRHLIQQLQYEIMYTKRYARRNIAVLMAMACSFFITIRCICHRCMPCTMQ